MKKIVLFALLFLTVLAQAQRDVSSDAVSDALAAAEALSVPTVLLKVDDEGNAVPHEKVYFFSKEKPSVADAKETSPRNSLSLLAGKPYAFGVRWTFKASKIIELGAEGGYGFSVGYAGPVVNLVPLSFAGIDKVYGGYRLYGLAPVNYSTEFDHGRVHAVVGGFRHRSVFGEVGRGFQKKSNDGLIEKSRPWIISFGFVFPSL